MTTQSTLPEMLRYRRPAGSGTERAFIKRFLMPLGAQPDHFGNLILRIGKDPVLWSSHTDTVHHKDGMQDIAHNGQVYKLAPNSSSNCLGADCTTGVWIMTEMVKANVPGLYIWHRAEETGGGGSTFIAYKTPHLLDGINYAIAFDRKGTDSIITHQFGRCASDKFAASLGTYLPGLFPDDTGIFTDTANYTHIVPECTNLSIGYSNAHGPSETQDIAFPTKLLEYIKRLDTSKLVIARNPSIEDPFNEWNDWRDDYKIHHQKDTNLQLRDLIRNYPDVVADLLEQYGMGANDILDNMRIYHQ